MNCSPPGSSVPGDSPGKNIGVGCYALPRGSSQPRDWAQVLCIAGGFFTVWVTRETGVGSLSLLQGIFLTQELNQGLLHCRQILYQLRYQASQGSSRNLLKIQTLDPHPKPAELETVRVGLENLLPGDSDAQWSLSTTVLFISQRVGKRNFSKAKCGDRDIVRDLGAHPFQVGQALGTPVCLHPLGTLDISKLLISLSQSLTTSFNTLA